VIQKEQIPANPVIIPLHGNVIIPAFRIIWNKQILWLFHDILYHRLDGSQNLL